MKIVPRLIAPFLLLALVSPPTQADVAPPTQAHAQKYDPALRSAWRAYRRVAPAKFLIRAITIFDVSGATTERQAITAVFEAVDEIGIPSQYEHGMDFGPGADVYASPTHLEDLQHVFSFNQWEHNQFTGAERAAAKVLEDRIMSVGGSTTVFWGVSDFDWDTVLTSIVLVSPDLGRAIHVDLQYLEL